MASCSFLNKIYVMGSADALNKFMKNPRPYLMPPQPRAPCKIAVVGPSTAGKTSIAHLLAQQYNAKVLDMNQLIVPKLDEERKRQLEVVRREATEISIQTVMTKLKEEMEAAKTCE